MKQSMKKMVSVVLSFALVLCIGGLMVTANAEDAKEKSSVTLNDEKDQMSYSIGVQMGQGLKDLASHLNLQVLFAAIEDSVQGRELAMSQEEIQKAMMSIREVVMAERQKQADVNKEKGAAFLAENGKKDGWVTLESGLQYKVLTEGKGEKPKESDRVKVHYKGTLIDGTQFDSSYDRGEPATFGVTQVIKGWTEALLLMPAGSKWQLAIPSDLAYGPQGRPQIPSNSVLLFDVELLEIVAPEPTAANEVLVQ